MKNKIVVITRFHYPLNHPDFAWRFEYYKKEVFPRLLAQTDQGFDIAIWCEPHHEDLFKQLHSGPGLITFQAEYQKRDSHLFIDYTDWSKVTGLEKYETQIGLDSDDLVEPTFIATVRSLAQGDKSILMSFQPTKYDLATGKRYQMRQYDAGYGSPIFAFYQPDGSHFKFAYHTSHLRMPLVADKVVLVKEGLVQMSIHGKNDSTKIKPTDKEI